MAHHMVRSNVQISVDFMSLRGLCPLWVLPYALNKPFSCFLAILWSLCSLRLVL